MTNTAIRRMFPNYSSSLLFDPSKGGYVACPVEMRYLLRLLSPQETTVWLTLRTFIGQNGVSLVGITELASLAGFTEKYILKYLKALEEHGFLSVYRTKTTGRICCLFYDPAITIQHLCKAGKLTHEDVDDINSLVTRFKMRSPIVLNGEGETCRNLTALEW